VGLGFALADVGELAVAYVALRVLYLLVVVGLIVAMYRFLHRWAPVGPLKLVPIVNKVQMLAASAGVADATVGSGLLVSGDLGKN
jgi:hypothetical protein